MCKNIKIDTYPIHLYPKYLHKEGEKKCIVWKVRNYLYFCLYLDLYWEKEILVFLKNSIVQIYLFWFGILGWNALINTSARIWVVFPSSWLDFLCASQSSVFSLPSPPPKGQTCSEWWFASAWLFCSGWGLSHETVTDLCLLPTPSVYHPFLASF